MANQSNSEPSFLRRSLQFLFDYFLHSDDKWKAWLLFAASVICVLAVTALGFVLGWWCLPFIFTAFIAKELTLVLIGIGAGILIAGGMAAFNYLANYFKNTLYVDWRAWLTKKLINQYLKNKTNYLEISRIYKDLDNPEQRIQEDIDKVVDSALDLSIGFINNFTNLTLYMVLLGMAGGTLSIVLFGAPLVIPGYLILVALLLGGVTSLIGYFINKSLRKYTNEETKTQSDLRSDLQQLNNFSEEIALEDGEEYHQVRLYEKVNDLYQKTSKRLSVQNNTDSFNLFNEMIQIVIPILASIPLYFNDLISLDVFYSSGYYFSMVARSLTWFINSFETINQFKTSLNRIIELQIILDANNEEDEVIQNIQHTMDYDHENLEVKHLDLNLHGSKELIMKGLDLKFTPGTHTLIQARSGIGKSSLFKAIAGIWPSGEGEIIIPNSLKTLYFLPQTPWLPDATLREVLCYPRADCPYSDDVLIAALTEVNMKKLIDKLDENIGFKSLGEKQRIAFARILLRKPDWVFLDEATASLDEEDEEQIYSCIKKILPKTTIISIAHRSTVRPYHDRILFFKMDDDTKEIQVIEKKNVGSEDEIEFEYAEENDLDQNSLYL